MVWRIIFFVKTDIDIAREAEIKPIEAIAAKLGIADKYLEQYGKYKAKVNLSIIPEKLKDHKRWQINFSHRHFAYSSWRGQNYHERWSCRWP